MRALSVLLVLTSILIGCKNIDSERTKVLISEKVTGKTVSLSDDKNGYSIIYVSGDSVKNLKNTLKGIQHMRTAYDNFLNNSSNEQDGELISEIPDMKIASELIALAMRQKGLKKINKNELSTILKTRLNIDLERSEGYRSWIEKEGLVFYCDYEENSLDYFVPSIWLKGYNSIDLDNNIIYLGKFFYFYNSDNDIDEIYDKETNMFKIKVWNTYFHTNMYLFNNSEQSKLWLDHNQVSIL